MSECAFIVASLPIYVDSWYLCTMIFCDWYSSLFLSQEWYSMGFWLDNTPIYSDSSWHHVSCSSHWGFITLILLSLWVLCELLWYPINQISMAELLWVQFCDVSKIVTCWLYIFYHVHCSWWLKTDAGFDVKVLWNFQMGLELQNGGGRPEVEMKFGIGFPDSGVAVSHDFVWSHTWEM